MDLCLTNLDAIVERVARASRVLVLSDFDGTLAPIVDHPSSARIAAPALAALRELAVHPRAAVGIISSRSLTDVAAHVGIPEAVYAGNHGLEIAGRGLHFNLLQPSLRPLVDKLEVFLKDIPGVWIENKTLTATVHMRHAGAAARVKAERLIREIVEESHEHRWRHAIEAVEVFPRVAWNKGSAARWIREELGFQDALTLFAGDDGSDEDAFAALPDDVTIKIGREPTKALHRIESPEEYWDLLARIAAALR